MKFSKALLVIGLLAVCALTIFLALRDVKLSNEAAAKRDARCKQELVTPPARFKRSADCSTWTGVADAHTGRRI